MVRSSPFTLSSLRTIALFALLVVGLIGSFAFHAAMTDMQVEYTATSIQHDDDPKEIAHASQSVADLDGRLERKSSEIRRPVEKAAKGGSFAGNVTPELYIILDGMDTEYAVYNDSYYRWNTTVHDETTFVEMQMTPADSRSVLEAVSKPYGTASANVQEAIDPGSVTGRNMVEPGIYRRGGTYYAVVPENTGALAANIIEAFFGYVLTPVGRGFVAVALGLLAYQYRNSFADRVLTIRRALVVAALGIPTALIGTAVFESGSLTRYLTSPASTFVVSAGVVAGVLVHQRRWGRLAGWTALVCVLSIGASVLALGVGGVAFGGFRLLVGLLAGVVSLGFGAWFAQEQTDTPAESVGA
ncbi:hypothetical protein [Haloferax profundi]|uniref:Uncharacterized protein n=1 Tax=Haloferax profundi TaxID=1544718 RepID=A0A0W1RDW7_9EURY|nr:hypothetical protein [Haloferax profundi]KTG11613.1 hypothetical protein AUR66_20000 [Haloferax profundi]